MIQIVGPQLTQWDTGRQVIADILVDSGVVAPNVAHVHFANQGDARAVIMDIENGQAKIPDYLLQTGKSLCVYLVLDGVTQESKTFHVTKRERPENYVYEEDQRNYIYELITGAENAIQSANVAGFDAAKAATNANVATESATEASKNANDAANSATLAADNANKAATQAAHTAKSLMVVGEAKGEVIALDDAIDQFLVGCRIFGKTTQNGTPTPDAPVELVSVGDSGSISVKIASVNLAEPMRDAAFTDTGVTFSPTEDGNLILNGTVSGELWKSIYRVATVRGQTYTVSGALGVRLVVWCTETEQQVAWKEPNQSYISFTANSSKYVLCVSHHDNETFNNLRVNCTAYPSTTPLHWTPYNGQSATISTPNGLPGIPVTSGGNYTDANGQQWVCDEIDFARGVYVQRIGHTNLAGVAWVKNDSGKYFTTKNHGLYSNVHRVVCTHIKGGFPSDSNKENVIFINANNDIRLNITLDDDTVEAVQETMNGATLIGVLVSTIETPLSEEELAAYASMHTYKDHTTVSNDAGAYMELEYVMDAKKYIDSLVTGTIVPARVE